MAFSFDKITARKSAFAARKAECGFVGALKSEEGAIDLASIMVGVIVIGVIAGVIAATVFAVIPWSQDKAAKQGLDSVNQAESVAYAQSTDQGAAKFLDKTAIVKHDGANATPGLLQDSKNLAIKSDGTTYTAVSVSATGNLFFTTNANPNTPTEVVKAGDLTATIAASPVLTAAGFVAADFVIVP